MARRWWIGLGTSCGPRLLPAALPSSRGRGPGEAARGTGPKGDLSQNGYGPVVVAADVVVIVVVLAITVAIAVLVLVTVLFLQADSAGAQGQGLSQRQSANRASQRLKSATPFFSTSSLPRFRPASGHGRSSLGAEAARERKQLGGRSSPGAEAAWGPKQPGGRSSPGAEAAWGPKQPGGGSSPGPKQPAHGSLNLVLRAAPSREAAPGAHGPGAVRPGLVAAAPEALRRLDEPLWQRAGCFRLGVGLGAETFLVGPLAALPPARRALPCGLVGRLLGPLIGIDAWSVDLVGWLAGWFVRFVGWLVELLILII